MFAYQLIDLYKTSDYLIWYCACADLNNDVWTFQKVSKANVPDMNQWVESVKKDVGLNNDTVKNKAISVIVPFKTLSTLSKKDLLNIFAQALIIDENKVRFLVRKTKQQIRKWILKYAGSETLSDESLARYLVKL